MKFLVTAGPTREPLDPVRFLSNRSSGKMGFAVAAAARGRGHEVILITGPVALPDPQDLTVTKVTTAEEMRNAVAERLAWCDVLVMAAAVADFRPAHPRETKIKKSERLERIEIEATPDILAGVQSAKGRRIFAGFAAETGDAVAEATRKLREKGLDLIVANDVTAPDAGFDVDTNRVTLIPREGESTELPLLSKREVADHIVTWVERYAAASNTDPAPKKIRKSVDGSRSHS